VSKRYSRERWGTTATEGGPNESNGVGVWGKGVCVCVWGGGVGQFDSNGLKLVEGPANGWAGTDLGWVAPHSAKKSCRGNNFTINQEGRVCFVAFGHARPTVLYYCCLLLTICCSGACRAMLLVEV